MDKRELEEMLEGGSETQSIEFKRSCPCSIEALAKDILALSNVQDGGYIVVGIEDGTLNRTGVSPADKATYDVDSMRDQMAAFADPHVNFAVEFPLDKDGKQYVVIRVLEFEEIPVICRKDSKQTRAGTIYHRNKNRRPESAPVSNSYDMRDIISLAAVKMMQRHTKRGFTVQPSAKQELDDELKGL